MRSISNIIAVLGLIGIAVVATVIGYNITMNHLPQSLKPNPSISMSCAKLVFITSNEQYGGTTYVTFKGEMGISNTGRDTMITVCIMSYYTSGTTYSVTVIKGNDPNSCPLVLISTGYNAYGFIKGYP